MNLSGLETLILNIAWPFLLAYAWYRVVLAIWGVKKIGAPAEGRGEARHSR